MITKENYFNQENTLKYFSVSQIKDFMKCEASFFHYLNLNNKKSFNENLAVSKFFDILMQKDNKELNNFEKELLEKGESIRLRNGNLKTKYQNADDIKSLLESVVYRYVRDRKITINFAVNKDSDLSVDKMNKYFDKEKCVVKITPIRKTKSVEENGIDTNNNFDVYEKFEQPLVKDGWDIIISLSSQEEEEKRITCGNSLLKTNNLI